MGSSGLKIPLFFFNQPRGVVTTTSSNCSDCPSLVRTIGLADRVSIPSTSVLKWIVDCFIAGFDISARIFLYVLAQKRFSTRVSDYLIYKEQQSYRHQCILPAKRISDFDE